MQRQKAAAPWNKMFCGFLALDYTARKLVVKFHTQIDERKNGGEFNSHYHQTPPWFIKKRILIYENYYIVSLLVRYSKHLNRNENKFICFCWLSRPSNAMQNGNMSHIHSGIDYVLLVLFVCWKAMSSWPFALYFIFGRRLFQEFLSSTF